MWSKFLPSSRSLKSDVSEILQETYNYTPNQHTSYHLCPTGKQTAWQSSSERVFSGILRDLRATWYPAWDMVGGGCLSVSSGSHGQGAIRVFLDSGDLLCHREKTAWKFLTDLSVSVLGPTLPTWAGNQLGVRIGKEKDHLWGNSTLWSSHLSLLWLEKHPPPQGQVFSPSLFQKSAWKGCAPLDPPLFYVSIRLEFPGGN